MTGTPLPLAEVMNEPAPDFPSAEFIAANGVFTDEKDRTTAVDIADRLAGRLAGGEIDETTYYDAMNSLIALVPLQSGERDGRPIRSIDGKNLNANQEALVDSRLEAEEIDITGPDGSWGTLPSIVKHHLTSHERELKMELTNSCTLACRYCSFARSKGPVAEKASYGSVTSVIDYFAANQPKPHYKRPITDSLYWGTDPFDAKWAGDDETGVLDYTDLAKYHEQRSQGRNRRLYTSTSMPVGEDLKVLGFTDYILSTPEHKQHHTFRISITDVNRRRFNHVVKVLAALYPDYAEELTTNDVMDHVAAMGKAAERAETFSLWDITSPNSRDGVLIAVRSADYLIMQGTSEERTAGEIREPIETESDGDRVFTIPRQYHKPGLKGYDNPRNIYPMVNLTEITVHPDDSHEVRNKNRAHDPHRALLRLAGGIIHLQGRTELGKLTPEYARRQFRTYFSWSVREVRDYLQKGGHNRAMEHLLGQIASVDILDIE